MSIDWMMAEPPERFEWLGQGPVSVCRAFGPLAAAAPLALGAAGLIGTGSLATAGTAAALGMTVLGGLMQASAQREAGAAAEQEGRDRQRVLNQQAQARDIQANSVEAAKQREAIEAKRKYVNAASRAQAVMAAGGAGVDESLISGILGEGEYAKDVAIYEGEQSGQNIRTQANYDRYEGRGALARGQNANAARNREADFTLISTIGKAGMSGLSMADKYGWLGKEKEPVKAPGSGWLA